MGQMKEADGRLKGDLALETVQCDTTANTCQVKVPAPGFALVYLSDGAISAADAPSTVETFATTAVTKYKNTATIDEAVLATSNGNRGMQGVYGSTSFGSGNGAQGVRAGAGASVLLAVALGAAGVMRALVR